MVILGAAKITIHASETQAKILTSSWLACSHDFHYFTPHLLYEPGFIFRSFMQKRKILCADALSYLPPIDFFVRASVADVYLLADDIQFSTNGSSHRAKIKTAGGARMLSLPVLTKSRGSQLINRIELDHIRHWQRRHWRSIEVNYCNAPYFDQFTDEIASLFKKSYRYIHEVNLAFTHALWRWLQMSSMPGLTSEFPSSLKKEARLVDLAKRTGTDIYLCGTKYRRVLSPEIFSRAGIQLCFADFSEISYPQLFGDFEPNLSALDLLLNEGPHAGSEHIERIAARVRNEISQFTS
jgi:hypothetical protein